MAQCIFIPDEMMYIQERYDYMWRRMTRRINGKLYGKIKSCAIYGMSFKWKGGFHP